MTCKYVMDHPNRNYVVERACYLLLHYFNYKGPFWDEINFIYYGSNTALHGDKCMVKWEKLKKEFRMTYAGEEVHLFENNDQVYLVSSDFDISTYITKLYKRKW